MEIQMKKNILALLFVFLTVACATNPDGTKMTCTDDESRLETYNRAMFNFNYHLDKKVIKPVAKGYKKVTNQFTRDRVSYFFNNLEEPAYAVNNLLQGEFKDTGVSVGRFLVNSTLGLLGTFDVASGWGLETKKNSFDGTMAKYCIPDGPFIVIPVLGPATPRYLVGWGADSLASPMYWAMVENDDNSPAVVAYYGAVGLKYLNKRAEGLEFLDDLEESSVDFYATMKSAFMQNRQKFKSLCASAEQINESYDFDFGYDDPDEDADFENE